MSAEVFSLVIMLVLMLNYFERRWYRHPTRRLYSFCILLSTAAIVLNILCVAAMSPALALPTEVHLLLNSSYFIAVVGLSALVGHYLAVLILEHTCDRKTLRRFDWFLAALTTLYLVLLVWNLYSGALFYFESDGLYYRGPIIYAGYAVMLVELGTLLCITVRHIKSISTALLRVMKILPAILLLLLAYQLIYPDVLFNGGLIVAVNLVLLLNFQNHCIEQDALAGAGNRRSLYQSLTLRLGGRQSFQIIQIAIRQFGSVNTNYGNERGDAIICQVVEWLNHLHRRGRVFRPANLQLVLLVPYTDAQSAQALRQKILSRFQEPWDQGELQIVLRAYFGELICTGQPWNATEILECLNYSIGVAAEQEDGFAVFGEDVYHRIEQREHVSRLLRTAIADGRIEVWYQPLFHHKTGTFAAAEALMRMRDENGALVSPAVFIPVAERDGLLDELTDVVLEETCHLLGSGQLPPQFSISVNVSMRQFLSDRLVERLADYRRRGCEPHRLKLEITEETVAGNRADAAARIRQLTAMGIDVCMDDFGTGYSNLSAMLDYCFPVIKMDKSLIDGYPGQDRSARMVDALLELFHSMDAQVVVEGVETQEQAQALLERGADWIQGFYYARPMPRQELLALLATAGT